MRTIAIDLGSVRVGVAISDELGSMAHPRPYLSGASTSALLEQLRRLAESEGAGHFLVGLPRQLDGKEGRSARAARQFAAALERHTGLPVTLCDEWLTTREAHSRLRAVGMSQKQSRSRVDSAAAAILLQSWLDRRPGTPE